MRRDFAVIFFGLFSGVAIFLVSCSSLELNSSPTYPLPAINGFNAAGDIESAHLLAYWPFDGNLTEKVQQLKPSPSQPPPGYSAGIKGLAYRGKDDTYVAYPIGNLGTATSLTISIWMWQPAAPVVNTTQNFVAALGAQGMLMLYDDSARSLLRIDNEIFAAQPGHDSLSVAAGFATQFVSVGKSDSLVQFVPQGFLTYATGYWTQLVVTYDALSSKFAMYQNGRLLVVLLSGTAAANAGPVLFTVGQGSAAVGLGKLQLAAPVGVLIGAFPQALHLSAGPLTPLPEEGNFQGALDEIRIYNVALSATEVTSLYQLEFAGR